MVDDLQWAMRDPDSGVRNNAMRSLGAIAVLAASDPEYGIHFTTTWLVEMLNSLLWSDRNKAAFALVNMTEKRDARILDHIREAAPSGAGDMARWKTWARAAGGHPRGPHRRHAGAGDPGRLVQGQPRSGD